MRKKVVIHIGTHKTATSTIQDALEENRSDLKKYGILYGKTNRKPWPKLPKHTSIYSAAVSGDKEKILNEQQAIINEFERSGCGTLVLSEEGLSEPKDVLANFFYPFFENYDVRVICFLRRQDFFVESLYNQFVREHARLESRSIVAFLNAPLTQKRLMYSEILSRWKVKGAEIFAYDFNSVIQSVGIVNKFFDLLGVPRLHSTKSQSNSSPDMRLAVTLSNLNKYNKQYSLVRLLEAEKAVAKKFSLTKNKFLLGRIEREKLLAKLSRENEALESLFSVRFATELPVDEGEFPVEHVDSNYALALICELSNK